MIKRAHFAALFVTALLAIAGTPRPAHAQLGWTFVGFGEFDTDDVFLVLGSVSVSPRRPGWSPVGGLSVHWLQYPIGSTTANDRRTVTAIVPSVGLKNSFGTGAFLVRAGYSITNRKNFNEAVPAFTAEGNDDGVVTSAQLDYWGRGEWMNQAIASYNFGSQSFWGRGRLGHRILSFGSSSSLALGGEAAYLNSTDYSATKVGGFLGFTPGPGTGLEFSVGRKFGQANASDATYFGFGLVLYPH